MTIPRTPFATPLRRRRSTPPGSVARTELMANYLQEIIEDAVQVGWLSGYTPQFILHSISEAMVNDKELSDLAKAWTAPATPSGGIGR